MDRPKEENTPKPMKVKETFFIKYILKPQPMSTGKYMLTIKPGVNFKVCKLVVTHIGKAIMITVLLISESPSPHLCSRLALFNTS